MMWPHLTIYCENCVSEIAVATTYGPIAFIRPLYRHDEGLHMHEWQHVDQWWEAMLLFVAIAVSFATMKHYAWMWFFLALAPFAHGMAYTWIRRYRLHCEREAYRVQTRYRNTSGVFMSFERAAVHLTHPAYKFDITFEHALTLIKK